MAQPPITVKQKFKER